MKNEKLRSGGCRRFSTRLSVVFSFFIFSFSFFIPQGCTKTEKYDIPVTGVSVLPTQLELAIRERRTMVATVLPRNATNKSVTWESTEPEIVSIDERGRIRANAPGNATVTVTTEEGKKKASCEIVVREDAMTYIYISNFPELSGSVTLPFGNDFDNIRAEILGKDYKVIITTINTRDAEENKTLTLPGNLPQEELCKVGRDAWNDFEGFWPAEGVSNRDAKVAKLGDIFAYKGDTAVGRLYLTSWDGKNPAAKGGAYMVYFHYADQPFTLSGENLIRSVEPPSLPIYTSIRYNASFEPGWNIYYTSYRGSMTYTTTAIPVGTKLNWVFEDRP